jgi:hypothetical protein
MKKFIGRTRFGVMCLLLWLLNLYSFIVKRKLEKAKYNKKIGVCFSKICFMYFILVIKNFVKTAIQPMAVCNSDIGF